MNIAISAAPPVAPASVRDGTFSPARGGASVLRQRQYCHQWKRVQSNPTLRSHGGLVRRAPRQCASWAWNWSRAHSYTRTLDAPARENSGFVGSKR